MKNAINAIIGLALIAAAYGIGKAEGTNVKEKATAFGLDLVAKGKKAVEKGKEIIGNFIPKTEAEAPAEEAPAAEEEK